MYSLGLYLFTRLWEPGNYFIPFLISFFTCMGVTLLIYHFYYRWVDKTGIRFSEKMGKRITS